MRTDAAIAKICHHQHGAVSRDQLNLARIDRTAIRRRVRSGALLAVSSQVLVQHGSPDTPRRRVMIAVLDAGPGAVASHDTALALAPIPGFTLEPVHVTQPRAAIERRDRLAVLHTSRRIPPDHITIIDGIPVTTPTRSLFDIAGSHHPAHVERALDACWTRGLTDHRQLAEALHLLARRGRTGIQLMRELIAARGPDYVAPESGVEGRFHQIVEDDGQPPLLRQVRWQTAVGEFRFDAFDERARVDFEIDSALHHRSLTDTGSDDRRDAAVQDTDVAVVRIADEDIWHHPREVARQVREARRRRPARPTPERSTAEAQRPNWR